MAERASALVPNTRLGTCSSKLCRAAAEKTGRLQWKYSFEAECLLGTDASSCTRSGKQLCHGFVVAGIPALQPGQPYQPTISGDDLLQVLDMLRDVVQQRPVFAELLDRAEDKSMFIDNVKPYLCVGAKAGIRSSFCGIEAAEPLSTCQSCHALRCIMHSDQTLLKSM